MAVDQKRLVRDSQPYQSQDSAFHWLICFFIPLRLFLVNESKAKNNVPEWFENWTVKNRKYWILITFRDQSLRACN